MSLQIGDSGPLVEVLQAQIGADIDGTFGRQTKSLVIAFQAAHGLYPDGIVGPKTQSVLNALNQGTHPDNPTLSRVLLGDVYDGDIVDDWNKAHAFGMEGCWIKACQGINRIGGRRYLEHRNAIQAAGMRPGAYHFPMFDQSIKQQINFFCDLVEQQGGVSDRDLMPMLDHEYYPESRGVEKGDGTKALEMLHTIETRLKRVPVLYSGYFTYSEIFQNEPDLKPDFAKYPFLLAWYTSEKNIKVPSPWTDWTFWQFSGSYPVPGVSRTQGGTMDAEWFKGDLDDLEKLIQGGIIK